MVTSGPVTDTRVGGIDMHDLSLPDPAALVDRAIAEHGPATPAWLMNEAAVRAEAAGSIVLDTDRRTADDLFIVAYHLEVAAEFIRRAATEL